MHWTSSKINILLWILCQLKCLVMMFSISKRKQHLFWLINMIVGQKIHYDIEVVGVYRSLLFGLFKFLRTHELFINTSICKSHAYYIHRAPPIEQPSFEHSWSTTILVNIVWKVNSRTIQWAQVQYMCDLMCQEIICLCLKMLQNMTQ